MKEEGIWRTVGGRRIFIRTGQNLSDAMIESGKFKRPAEEISKYKSKNDFIDYVETEIGVKLENINSTFNNKRNILYTKISQNNKSKVLSFLASNNIRYEQHIEDKYWIYFKK